MNTIYLFASNRSHKYVVCIYSKALWVQNDIVDEFFFVGCCNCWVSGIYPLYCYRRFKFSILIIVWITYGNCTVILNTVDFFVDHSCHLVTIIICVCASCSFEVVKNIFSYFIQTKFLCICFPHDKPLALIPNKLIGKIVIQCYAIFLFPNKKSIV